MNQVEPVRAGFAGPQEFAHAVRVAGYLARRPGQGVTFHEIRPMLRTDAAVVLALHALAAVCPMRVERRADGVIQYRIVRVEEVRAACS